MQQEKRRRDDPKAFGQSKWKTSWWIAEMVRTEGAAGVCGLSFALGKLEMPVPYPGGNVP